MWEEREEEEEELFQKYSNIQVGCFLHVNWSPLGRRPRDTSVVVYMVKWGSPWVGGSPC